MARNLLSHARNSQAVFELTCEMEKYEFLDDN
jgi:hypothetical protein